MPGAKSRILIAGCGYVGTATADLFHAAQWEVEGWTHSLESAAQLSGKPYAVRAVDITNVDAVQKAAAHFDVVLHCASSGGGDAESYRHIYLEGARNLLSRLQPGRFVFTSSTSVYAQTDGAWVDEKSTADPLHESGKVLRETEEFVRQNGGVIARLAGIYGPGRSALLRKFLSGEARIEEDGERYLNQVHRDDIASALLHLTNAPNETGTINVTDNQPQSERACYEWLATRFQRPLPPSVQRAVGRKRGASNKRVSNQKLRALGWEPRFPTFQDGMEKSVLLASPEVAR